MPTATKTIEKIGPDMTTITHLIATGENAAVYFADECGYTSTEFREVGISVLGGVTYRFHLHDDFQAHLNYNIRQHVGWDVEVTAEQIENLTSWPNREQRELAVLAAQLASIGENTDKIESAQAAAFVKRLNTTRRELALLTKTAGV